MVNKKVPLQLESPTPRDEIQIRQGEGKISTREKEACSWSRVREEQERKSPTSRHVSREDAHARTRFMAALFYSSDWTTNKPLPLRPASGSDLQGQATD
jgi:hypothetical protein